MILNCEPCKATLEFAIMKSFLVTVASYLPLEMVTQTQNLKWGRFSFFDECAVLSDHTVGSTQQVVLPAIS